VSKQPPEKNVVKQTPKEALAAAWKETVRPQQQPLISGKWLLSALGVVIAAAAFCAYATFCLLFYQGSWQLIFHPSRTVTNTPSVPYQEIQFDYTETGKPQLTGWWIPCESNARYASNTILFLHDGRGSLSDTVSQLQTLHDLGINVFAFDYRGFGKSADLHPSEASMNQDADAARAYVSETRHLPAHSIILYGNGLGASIAATTAIRHPEILAVILEDISPSAAMLFAADARTKFLPVRLLTSDRFTPDETLRTLQTPKFFLDRNHSPQTQYAFQIAGTPKKLFAIDPKDQNRYRETMQRFLDEVLAYQ
jgi:pimeloyl-ACP methyl ester carboxylesterase